MRRVFTVFLMLVSSAHAADAPPQQQLHQTLETLAKTKENEAELQQRLGAVRKEYEALQSHATELAEREQLNERRVGMDEKSLAGVRARVILKQQEFDSRQADYIATVSLLLRMRELPITALFAEPEHTQELMRTAAVLEKTNIAVAKKAKALAQDLQELKALKSDAAVRRQHTQAENEALDKEQAQLEKAMLIRQKLQAQLSVDHAHAEEMVAKLSRESESLQALIAKLDAQASKAEKVEKTKPPRKFAGGKGSLHAPVSGEVLHRYGDRKSNNETYRGMVFRARAGATVVAPYDGQVVFVGPFRDYGNMVLIKHQNGFISLIAGLGKLKTSLNQSVIRGEPIAVMTGDKDPEAYVELRDSDAKPIDPGDWFANVGKAITQKSR